MLVDVFYNNHWHLSDYNYFDEDFYSEDYEFSTLTGNSKENIVNSEIENQRDSHGSFGICSKACLQSRYLIGEQIPSENFWAENLIYNPFDLFCLVGITALFMLMMVGKKLKKLYNTRWLLLNEGDEGRWNIQKI